MPHTAGDQSLGKSRTAGGQSRVRSRTTGGQTGSGHVRMYDRRSGTGSGHKAGSQSGVNSHGRRSERGQVTYIRRSERSRSRTAGGKNGVRSRGVGTHLKLGGKRHFEVDSFHAPSIGIMLKSENVGDSYSPCPPGSYAYGTQVTRQAVMDEVISRMKGCHRRDQIPQLTSCRII